MLKTTTIQDGQTLADIAIQEYGTLAAVVPLAQANNLAISAMPPDGTLLTLPELETNRRIVEHLKPATGRDTSGIRFGIFTAEFTQEFQ